MNKLGLTLLVFALAGCASIDYEPVMLDSAAPNDVVNLQGCPAALELGYSCTARVQADKWTSPTGIRVKVGEEYSVEVLPNQVWFDGNRRNTPPYGQKGNRLMRLFQKRNPDAGFFSLIVNVQSKADAVEEKAGQVIGVSAGHLYAPKVAGELVLYPNDAKGPANDPAYWYKNNSGQIWVTITRCL